MVSVAVGVFLSIERLSAGRVEAFDEAFQQTDSMFYSVMNSASVASGIVLLSLMLSSNRKSIVACIGHLSE
jgi:ABC-type glycerol-3-phosphate transport system permease component